MSPYLSPIPCTLAQAQAEIAADPRGVAMRKKLADTYWIYWRPRAEEVERKP